MGRVESRPAETPERGAVIENEFASYRAISPMAVFSFLLGLGSILCFASSLFLAAAVLAIVTGVMAQRKIAAYSDVLTGASLAKAGMTLGLIFGLSSFTFSMVQSGLRYQAAKEFAGTFEKVLRDKTAQDAIWYHLPPEQRKTLTPKQAEETARKSSGANSPGAFDQHFGALMALKEKIDSPAKPKFQFKEIEFVGLEGLKTYATAVYDLDMPAEGPKPAAEMLAMAVIKGEVQDGKYRWVVDEIQFPYKPASYVAPAPKAADDGHGHAH